MFHIWPGRNVPLSKCLPLYVRVDLVGFCVFFSTFGPVEKETDVRRLFSCLTCFGHSGCDPAHGGNRESGSPTHTHGNTQSFSLSLSLCENVQHFSKRLDDSRISTIPSASRFNICWWGRERQRKKRIYMYRFEPYLELRVCVCVCVCPEIFFIDFQ